MNQTTNQAAEALSALDDKLSKRFIELDPQGYFIIYLDREAQLICAKHYGNTINEKGLACDPITGEVLSTRQPTVREPIAVFQGRTAKELCIKIFEETKPCLVSYLDHAAYLGREFVRAEMALIHGHDYIQD